MVNLDINHKSLLGFALPQLPYFKSTLKLAFPFFDVKEVPADERVYRRHHYEFRKPGDDELIFSVNGQTFWSDEQKTDISGYPHLLTVHHSDILIFDKYRLGKSLFKEFTSPVFERIGFDPREEFIEIEFNCGKHLSGSFYFKPPKGYSGSIKSMNEEQIGNSVLDFVFFVIGMRDGELTSLDSEKQGLRYYHEMLSVDNGQTLTTKNRQNAKTPVSPIETIIKKSFDFHKATAAYLRLANLTVHTGVKTKTKKSLQQALNKCGTDHPGPETLFEAVLFDRPTEDTTAWPLFSIDWKGTIKDDLDYAVRSQFGKLASKIDLPDLSSIPDGIGLLKVNYLKDYAKQIERKGYDLYMGGLAQIDSHEFLLAPIANRNKMIVFIRDSKSEMKLVYDAGQNKS